MKHIGTKTLETPRLTLRRLSVDDAEDMFNNWASSTNVTRFMTWPPYSSVEEVKEYIVFCADDYIKPTTYNWCIEYKDNGQAIGNIGAVSVRDDVKEITVGYCLGESYWHKGIMTEAFSRVIKFFFDEVGANRIMATHDANNVNSGKVMLKCGLLYEGTNRQAKVNNSGICDSVVYAILKQDYVGK